jgi:hypothetical protein
LRIHSLTPDPQYGQPVSRRQAAAGE